MKNITIEDLDRAREEYGEGYDEEVENLDLDYFSTPALIKQKNIKLIKGGK